MTLFYHWILETNLIFWQGEDVLEEAYISSGSKEVPNYPRPKRSKRSKRKRAV